MARAQAGGFDLLDRGLQARVFATRDAVAGGAAIVEGHIAPQALMEVVGAGKDALQHFAGLVHGRDLVVEVDLFRRALCARRQFCARHGYMEDRVAGGLAAEPGKAVPTRFIPRQRQQSVTSASLKLPFSASPNVSASFPFMPASSALRVAALAASSFGGCLPRL